ncbi:hypothetical protein NW819_06280, partial [Synechococcus sp. R8-2]
HDKGVKPQQPHPSELKVRIDLWILKTVVARYPKANRFQILVAGDNSRQILGRFFLRDFHWIQRYRSHSSILRPFRVNFKIQRPLPHEHISPILIPFRRSGFAGELASGT